MNADRLLSHFERISDAPDAVERLRRFVLDLAVRGKLVEQDPADEPHPIATAEAQIPNAPFPVPSSWRWIAFGGVHDLVRGVTYTKSDVGDSADDQHVAVLRANNIGARLNLDDLVYVRRRCVSDEQMLRQGDFLIALSSGSKNLVGKAASVEEPVHAAFGGFCGVVRLNDEDLRPFVRMYLSSPLYREAIAAGSRGIGINNLKRSTLDALPFPLPPLAEQHRIVEKVDELMQLCDRLEASQKERESRRDRLVVASLNRLSQSTDPDEFKKDATFQLSNLNRLSTKPEHIKELRKAILNLAVRGKLVPQDESEGTAATAVRATEHGASIELPHGWRWVRIADLLDSDSQNGYSKKPDDDPTGVPILRISAATVRSDRIIAEEEYKLIGGVSKKHQDQFQLVPGDLLACRFNGNKSFVGRMAEYRGSHGKAFIYPDKLIRLRLQASLAIPSLLRHFGESDVVRSEVEGFCATTVGNWGISATNLKAIHIPLPPLAEQKRIVAKVDELMLICDQLESQLETQQKGRRQLLEALLHEALEGVG